MKFLNFKSLLKFGVAGGLIYWMIKKGLLDVSNLTSIISPWTVTVGLFLVLLNIVLNNYRWGLLLQSQNLQGNFRFTFPLTLIGLFFNFAVPGAVGGDIIKAFYAAKDNQGQRLKAVTTVMMDRIIGLMSMLLMAIITMVMNWNFVLENSTMKQVFISSLGIFSGMVFFLALALSHRFVLIKNLLVNNEKLPGFKTILKIYTAIQGYRNSAKYIVATIIVSFLAQSMAVFFMVYIGSLLGENLSLSTYFFAVPLGFIVMALPISPAGIGVGQVAFLVLFRLFTHSETSLGQSVITAFQIGLLAWGIIGAIIYAQKKEAPELKEVNL